MVDYNLAHMTGLDFYHQHEDLLKKSEVIFLSGQSDLTVVFEIIKSNVGKYVIKDENMLKCLDCLFIGDYDTYEELL